MIDLTDTVSGSGEIAGDCGRIFLVGGQPVGAGVLVDGHLMDLAGSTSGDATVDGGAPYLFGAIRGTATGVGTFGEVRPLPVHGFGILSGYLEVVEALPPICGCCCKCQQGTVFQYGADISGQLTLSITDVVGNPYSPECVTYALYRVSGQARVLVCAPVRYPSQDGVGVYHATGFLPDCGQPGQWVIEWTFSGGGATGTLDQTFTVVAGPPITSPCGCPKYGWD